MKKISYVTPEMEVIEMLEQSIIATSGTEIPGFEAGGDLSE